MTAIGRSADSTLETGLPARDTSGMSLPPDYHMHTPLCRHAVGEPVEYARHALSLGFTEIGFSDHSPMARDDFDDWRMRRDQLDEYVLKVRAAQTEFPQLAIKLALEVDYLPGQEDWICQLAARHPWDYFIGSVHYVTDSWDIDNPNKLSQWKHRDPDEVWVAYFERLRQAAASGLFEIIGHADLPKKFGHRPTQDCKALYTRFLAACKQTDTAIELNTAGLRKDCKEIYPSRQILELAFAQGVPITFGSDAHAPDEVGLNFAEAIQLARAVGYRESRRFQARKRLAAIF
ncbi:MAG TPA: histidinol-phosphatase HisJ family protein [Dongiaceae bacterium]|jgi:histidinol-phosphatase (PHP family)|nr:histidinol-phosphatase HisJ family protein [Dongiaceae bacterium]